MSELEPGLDPLSFTACPHCGREVPPGEFCGHCGGHLAGGSARRLFSFALAPHEHVMHLALISTLLPHLPLRHGGRFRLAFAAGLLTVGALAALHLLAAASAVALVVLPLLYLLYLYEVQIYRHEPVAVVAATFGVGAAVGLLFRLLSGGLVGRVGLAPQPGGVLLAGVLLPLVAQALMLVGPLLLLSRGHFNETLDGLSFGVASALGFSLTSAAVGLGPLLIGSTDHPVVAADLALRVLRAGVLTALVNASATGLLTAPLWLRHHGRSLGRHLGSGPPALAGLVALAAQVALGVAALLFTDLLGLVVLWALVAALLMLLLRLVVHLAVLDESGVFSIGAARPCPECHRVVPSMLFCPVCGVAHSAAPKRELSGVAR
ncbi:MAG: hypothetical protein NVS3B18_03680 [Candidatus Dormibacteria bacterium]